MQIGKLPRIRLANLPTPLEEMPRLSKVLGGPRLWIKRDDYTGLALGGNKVRKLEFVMADAINKGANVVITTGDVQSNHARATAAAASKLGVKAVLVLYGEEPKECDGNLLLDHIFGADIRFVPDGVDVPAIMRDIAKELESEGHTPYTIPSGASYPVGAVGYVNAALEMLEQANDMGMEINYVVHAVGSGGTQAGLVLGNKALNTKVRVVGISVGPRRDPLAKRTAEIANGISKMLSMDTTVNPDEILIMDDYVGEEHVTSAREVVNAIRLVARTEGILLDPEYTGVAMAGLIDLIKKGHFETQNNVVFIHTGGTPIIFAHKKELKGT